MPAYGCSRWLLALAARLSLGGRLAASQAHLEGLNGHPGSGYHGHAAWPSPLWPSSRLVPCCSTPTKLWYQSVLQRSADYVRSFERETTTMPPRSTDDDEGINLLSLDGGGVRGVSSLVILDTIMKTIKDRYGLAEVPKPCDYFHMIAGSSTGGLIAIMLGRLRMSTKEALEAYDAYAAKIFSLKNRNLLNLGARFRAKALEEAIQGLVKERGMGEEMWDPEYPKKGKVIVCVMPSDSIGEARIVRSFRDPDAEQQWDEGITIWQAARATTAAPSFFKPQVLGSGPDAKPYIDAAIGANNPVGYLLREAVDEFGSARRLGCILSIGTGTRDTQLSGIQHIIPALKATATDCEEIHRQIKARFKLFPTSYFRFSVPSAASQVSLHHYKKIPELKSMTAKYLEEEEFLGRKQELAEGLQTDSFDHGLTLGLAAGLEEKQLILTRKKIQSLGAPSPYFVGRRDILAKLDSFFSPRNTQGKPRREFLLFGLGGVGKSELALKIAQDFEDRFEYIFFIDGCSSVTIDESYASIARRQNLGEGSTRVMKNLALQWMERLTDEWLLIFDDCNLDDRRGEIPARNRGNIIYTSRLTGLKDTLAHDCSLEVSPLGEEDAIELLLRASASDSSSLGTQQKASAEAIVRELGCLPLAVDKAAASMRFRCVSPSDYLEQLRKEKVRLGHANNSPDTTKPVENLAVYAALELSWQALKNIRASLGRSGEGRAADTALTLLSLLSFYHHKGIAPSMFKRAAEERAISGSRQRCPLDRVNKHLGWMMTVNEELEWQSTNFYVGLKLLERFSLVKYTRSDGTISMHVLVREWTQWKLEETLRNEHGNALGQWALAAKMIFMESIITRDALQDRRFARSLVPHYHACFPGRDGQPPLDEEYTAYLWAKMGWYHMQGKRFLEAERMLQSALHIHRYMNSNYASLAIAAMVMLAMLYDEIGQLADSELMWREAIERVRGRILDLEAYLRAVQQPAPRRGSQVNPSECPSPPKPTSPSKFRLLGLSPRLKRLRHRVLQRPSMANGVQVAKGPDPTAKRLRTLLGVAREDDDVTELHGAMSHMRAELAYVLLEQGMNRSGKHELLTAIADLEETLEQGHPILLKHQYRARLLTDPWNKAYWEKQLDEVVDPALKDGTINDLYMCEAWYYLFFGHAICFLNTGEWAAAIEMVYQLQRTVIQAWGIHDRRMLDLSRLLVRAHIGYGKLERAVQDAEKSFRQAEQIYGRLHTVTIEALEQWASAHFCTRLYPDDHYHSILKEALDRAQLAFAPSHKTIRRLRTLLERKRERRSLDVGSGNDGGIDWISRARWDSWVKNAEWTASTYGPDHMFTKRFTALVEGGPIESSEDMCARFRAFWGPDNPALTEFEENLRQREAILCRRLAMFDYSGTGKLLPGMWEEMVRDLEYAVAVCGEKELLSKRLRALMADGSPKTISEWIEKIRVVYGPENPMADRVEVYGKERYRIILEEEKAELQLDAEENVQVVARPKLPGRATSFTETKKMTREGRRCHRRRAKLRLLEPISEVDEGGTGVGYCFLSEGQATSAVAVL